MQFKPTEKQTAVLNAVQNTKKNIAIDAVAGAGKSTTLKMICNVLPADAKILFVAFNKSVQQEMQKKLPANVEVRTCHSIGFKVINDNYNRRFYGKIESDKYAIVMNEMLESKFFDPETNPSEYRRNVKKLVDLGRFEQCSSVEALGAISARHGIEIESDELRTAMNVIYKGRKNFSCIDFVDMIYYPAVLRINKQPLTFPKYDFVLIDEAQDLNGLQHFIIDNLVKPETGRFIAVGDPYQCIYSFMGADSRSFAKFAAKPNTVALKLDDCFRCPQSVIRYVQTRVPHINAFHKNPEGIVSGFQDGTQRATIDDVKPGDLILCCQNAPLLKACYKLLANDVPAYIRGKDFGKQLISFARKCRSNDLKVLLTYLEKWLKNYFEKLARAKPGLTRLQIAESSAYETACDKVDILKHMAISNGKVVDVNTLCQRITELFNDAKHSGVVLSTVHKAKGDEADRVFILKEDLFHKVERKMDWEIEQMLNLWYVAMTRPKKELWKLEIADDDAATDVSPFESASDNAEDEMPDISFLDD